MAVRVIHGPNEDHFSLQGHTVQTVARVLREVFNIPAAASAVVNGDKVRSDYLLTDGDTLEFVHTIGCKGGLHDYWSEAEVTDLFGAEVVQQMREAGLTFVPHPVLTSAELMGWQEWLRDQHQDPSLIRVRVAIDDETIAIDGTTFDIDQQLAAVVKCLVDAGGERRSQQDMKGEYPQYILDERLDTTIRRKLLNHKSGIGRYISSDTRGYWLDLSQIGE